MWTNERRRAWNRAYYAENREHIKKQHPRYRHGLLYDIWAAMKQRCNNKNYKQYKDYGGRGITYDFRWERFKNFKNEMEDGYKKGLTLDRIDTNGNYSKKNCRWVTRKEQNNNKRKHIKVNYQGKTMTLSQYADLIGIAFATLRSRFYRGMSMEKIMTNKKLSRWT
jgi:uncharacterized phage-associated protein